MKDYLKLFCGLAVVGILLLVLGRTASANNEIRSFDGNGALLAAYASLGLGLILLAISSFGLGYLLKKLLEEKIFETFKNRLKF